MTTATATAPAPPESYPAGDWAADPDDPFYVPEDLRELYAAAQPSAAEEAGYWKYGVSIRKTLGHDEALARARAAGKLTTREVSNPTQLMVDPLDVVHRRESADGNRYNVEVQQVLSGRPAFDTWLHITRLQMAATRRVGADRAAAFLTAHRCSICQTQGSMGTLYLPHLRRSVAACSYCVELAQLRINQTMAVDGGRSRQESVDEFLTNSGWSVN